MLCILDIFLMLGLGMILYYLLSWLLDQYIHFLSVHMPVLYDKLHWLQRINTTIYTMVNAWYSFAYNSRTIHAHLNRANTVSYRIPERSQEKKGGERAFGVQSMYTTFRLAILVVVTAVSGGKVNQGIAVLYI